MRIKLSVSDYKKGDCPSLLDRNWVTEFDIFPRTLKYVYIHKIVNSSDK